MCRLAAYLGPPIRLSAVLTEPAHGLLHQSYAPREMTDGTLNADGWGVGWFAPEIGPEPGVLKGTQPIWSDENATAAPRAIASGAFLAVVRGATPGSGVSQGNTPPFVWDHHVLAHNGRIWPWVGPVARGLRARLAPEADAALKGTTDSEVLGALWWTRLGREPGTTPADALRAALRLASGLASEHGGGLSAAIVLVRATGLLAARYASQGPAPSLYLRAAAPEHFDGTLLASEPLDGSDRWIEVPPLSLVRADASGACIEPLF